MAAVPPNTSQAQQGGQNARDPYQFDLKGRPTIMAYPNDLNGALAHRYRVRATPGKIPATDPTINTIQDREENCVADLMQAYFDISGANDNPGGDAITYCTRGNAHAFSDQEVEAACRLVHSKIIDRCRDGFRGHASEDWLGTLQSGIQRRNIHQDDVSGNCQVRFENVLLMLRLWKSECRSIMVSDSHIERLVNCPATLLAYKSRAKQGNLNKKKKKDETTAALRVAQNMAAQPAAQTFAAAMTNQATRALRVPGITFSSLAAIPELASQVAGGVEPPPRGLNNGGPPLSQGGPTSFKPLDNYGPVDRSDFVQHTRQSATTPTLIGHPVYGPGNHNTNHFRDLHYQLNTYGSPIDPTAFSPYSALSNGAGSNTFFGNSYGSAFGNGPGFGNGHDATYSSLLHPGLSNAPWRANSAPCYDSASISYLNRPNPANMGVDVSSAYGMHGMNRDNTPTHLNSIIDQPGLFPRREASTAHRKGHPFELISQPHRPDDAIPNSLSGLTLPSIGIKRSYEQSADLEEYPPTRRQRRDGDSGGLHDRIENGDEDTGGGGGREEEDREYHATFMNEYNDPEDGMTEL